MKKYPLKIHCVFISGTVLTLTLPLLSWLFFRSIPAAVLTAAGMTVLLILMIILHKEDDRYITHIVSELSRLTDTLTELEEKDIFPENEDTLVSKLQSKAIKLVHMLKMKNQQSELEQQSIKSLVSDISHQLKTPVSNLIMYSEFLENEQLSEKERTEFTAVIRHSAERLSFLSESMIKISRLECGLISMDMRKQSLNETVLKAVKDIYPEARQKNTEIIYHEEKNIIVSHDRNWTAEAVFNLLDNAVKYSEKGGKIYLTVSSYDLFSSVEVRDENPPVPENERAEIFRRFYRGSNSSGKDGIGIGLYLVREIAQKQGGYVKLSSDSSGNSFKIILR